jgi:hypothetical protein
MRYNPVDGSHSGYYRLVESYRNIDGRVCHRTMLNVGFVNHLTTEQLILIQNLINDRYEGKPYLFEQNLEPIVSEYFEKYWAELVSKKKIDRQKNSSKHVSDRLIKASTIVHDDVREIGAEWITAQSIDQLKIKEFLVNSGWEEQKAQLAITQLISRCVYPYSELRTSRWITENSAVCDITGFPKELINKDRLYQSALALMEVKDQLELHLSKRTNELFDISDKIILYDLTNTYFEGRKNTSKIAQFGRSKEKRTDAKLIVLAMVVNEYGFVKYSNLFEGNMSDSKSLIDTINKLRVNTTEASVKATVVLDAGIATEDNLALLHAKGYNYVCVSRTTLSDIEVLTEAKEVTIATKDRQQISVSRVSNKKNTDYYLRVKSEGKEKKESSMKNLFESRYEEGLEIIKLRLTKKHTIKKVDKINQSIGRLMQKYPSVSKYYNIELEEDQTGIATNLIYHKKEDAHNKELDTLGMYFIRTDLEMTEESRIWDIYNTIRQIESTFRCLKTDLDLRPIYHKSDNGSMAHLHLGVLAYSVVNTIRHQLKQTGINHSWTEIVRIAQTQKLVSTKAKDEHDNNVIIRKCSQPIKGLQELYNALHYKSYPFIKRKFVVHKPEIEHPDILSTSHPPPD